MAQLNEKIHDAIDYKIVELVDRSKNGVRLVELSKNVGLTWSGTLYRVKDLEKHGILKTSIRRRKFLVYPGKEGLNGR